VCCGVLYHLHSPVYLLELIANRTDPEYIILESVVFKNDKSEHKFTLRTEISTEVDNIPGNRYTLSEWKSAGLNMVFSQDVFDLVMNNLGYCIVKKDYALSRFNCESKRCANMTVYKKMIDITKEIKNIIARKGHDDMGSFEPYLHLISDNFKIATDKNVLEIGPFDGYHTDLMDMFGVKSVTLVEPNSNACEYLKNNFDQSNHTVINDDIFNYLSTDRTGQFDFVVCCGVLYHLHSPIYLLEQIVNKVNPKHILLETVDSKEQSEHPYHQLPYSFQPEVTNVPGNRYALNNSKSVQLHLSATMNLFEYCMGELGYKVIKKTKMFEIENIHSSKHHTSMVVFERID
jgi:2-polyprenyl-3-methyl-5-hydroxy-6-metoxy-1,4-benzoquinol methylase